MKKKLFLIMIFSLLANICSNGLVSAKNISSSNNIESLLEKKNMLEIKNSCEDLFKSSDNITFDIKVREKNEVWQDSNITAYTGDILEFKIRIETKRSYPLSLTAAISLPNTEEGPMFDYIENSQQSSRKTTMFNSSDKEIVFLWWPVLSSITITCSFQVSIKNTGDEKTVKGMGIGLIDENRVDYKNDSLCVTSKIPPIPEKPDKPSGPITGFVHENYTYNTSTTDPYNEDLYYLFYWGDRSYSEWIGPFSSGTTVEANHSWDSKGTYYVRVKSKNEEGFESSWSDTRHVKVVEKVEITKPVQGIYFANSKILNFYSTIIIGKIEVKVETSGLKQTQYVEFYIDYEFQDKDDIKPFTWIWKDSMFGRYTLRAIAYDNLGNREETKIRVLKIF
ncbi:MAG: PKD domain-containing protein [Candidatus Thermoplasmatota archaeon]